MYKKYEQKIKGLNKWLARAQISFKILVITILLFKKFIKYSILDIVVR